MRGLFNPNAGLVASDGLQARMGGVGAGKEWFKPWRTISGHDDAAHMPELEVVLRGVFEKRLFLDLLRYFIVFEETDGGKLVKKMAGYHQFHAVNVALEETLRAAVLPGDAARRGFFGEDSGRYDAGPMVGGAAGDRRVGVVWHTQGSGKSLTLAFYAGRVILAPPMQNSTILGINERNELYDQHFGTF